MAQQLPAGFVPDGFVPDDGGESLPAGFQPDKKEELQFETVEVRPGQFMSVKKGETPFQALKRVENRGDTGLYRSGERGAAEEGFNRISQGITNRIATSSWIPESLKGPLAGLASMHTEPFRLATEILSNPQPEDLLVPSVVKPSSIARTGTRTVVPKPPREMPPIVQKAYPPIMPQVAAEDTMLAQAMKMSDNPEQLLYPRTEPTGFAKYAAADESIQADIAARKAREDARFAKFMEPSPGPGQQIPATPGSTRMGFDELIEGIPEGPEGPLYWTIPQRLYPRRVQTSFEATIPERVKVPPSVAESVGEPVIDVLSPHQGPPVIKAGGGPLADAGVATVKPRTYEEIERWLDDITPAAPIVREAIAEPVIKQTNSWLRTLGANLAVSGRKRFERLGPVGIETRKLLNVAELEKREVYNQLTTPFLNTVKGLDSQSEALIQSALDFDTPIADPALNQIKDQIKALLTKSGEMAEAAGVRVENLKGEMVPFKKLDTYWPRRSTKLYQGKHRDFVAELMENNPKLSLAKAQRIAARARENAEFLDSFQRQRAGKGAPITFDYRKDLGAVLDHFAEVADKIARAKHLGPGDIGARDTTISRLIQSAPKDVQSELRDLVTTQLKGGMNDRNEYFTAVRKAKRIATKAMIFMKLAPYVISNINQQLAIVSRGTIGSWMKALATMPENRALAREYGTVLEGNIPANILSEAGNKPVPVVGPMIKWAEDFARSVATGAGKGAAQTFFTSAKGGSGASVKKLKDLLLEEDLDDILKQDRLTPEQIKLATQRFVEITQGLDSNMNIPTAWVNDPIVSVFTIFKNFAFQGTKTIWDGIKQDPYRTIPKLLILSPLFGELTGDLKSAVYGAIRGAPMPGPMLDAIAFEIANRHRFAGRLTTLDSEESDTNWLANRLVADVLQSWSLGLVADGLQATLGGESGGYGAVFGPAIETAMSPFEIGKDVLEGNFEEAGRETMRQLIPAPFGTSLQKRFLPTMSQEIPE